MKKPLIIFAFIMFQSALLHGQQMIETRLCFADTTRFPFTGEWQYLSTDVYLLNGNRFSKVINDLYITDSRKKRKRGLAEERLEYLYITAQLMNVKFFGENNVVYPLYNFRITQDKDDKYETSISDNIESIRIIDNLPLYSASDKIDAKIDVNAITQNDRDNILGIIGAQLRNLANLMTPSNAVLSLISEMGNFIEANSKKKEYKFSSTIRLFEQKNFDTRLHSVRVYALAAPNTPPIRVNSDRLKKYLDTCRMPDLSRTMLGKLIDQPYYPLIVVANYKSLYRMESISGDEVSFASIDKRKVTIENNYRDKLITEETYRQERDFIDFISIFANFKAQLELYTLNARMGNVDAVTNTLGTTTQFYCTLLQEYDKINYKYRNNKTFATIFKSEYASILDFASFYLENDHRLQAAKTMVVTMNNLNTKGMPKTTADMETALRNLRFIDNFNNDFKTKVKEGQLIITQIKNIETSLMAQSFDTDIATLKSTQAVSDRAEQLQKLKEKMGTTYCSTCREKAAEAVKDYYTRLDNYNRNEELKKYNTLVQTSEIKITEYINQWNVLKRNMPRIFPDTASLQYDLFNRRLLEINRDVANLDNYIRINANDKSTDLIKGLNEKIEQTVGVINENFEFIKHNKPDLMAIPPVNAAPVMINPVNDSVSLSTGNDTLSNVDSKDL